MSKDKETVITEIIDIDTILGGFSATPLEDKDSTKDKDDIKVDDKDIDSKDDDFDPFDESNDQDDTNEDLDDSKDVDNLDDSDIDEDGDEDEEIEYSYKALANHLAEQGVVDFEDSEDIEDSPELIEEIVLQTAKNMVEEYKESIPEEAKNILDYLEKGGDINKYLESIEKPYQLKAEDLEDEGNQKKVITEFLKTQNYTDEEIEETIKDFEDGLILEKQSKVAFRKLEKIHEKNKQELIKKQEEEILKREEAHKKYLDTIRNTISTSESLGGLSISNSEKKEFEKYLLNKNKDGYTAYEKDISEDPIKTQLELAYLKFKKFDFSKVAKEAVTKETKRIKGIVKSKDPLNKGKSRRIRSIEEEAADLSAFNF